MIIFSQTLSHPEYTRVLKEARRYTMGLHMSSDRYLAGKLQSPLLILIVIIITLRTSGKENIF